MSGDIGDLFDRAARAMSPEFRARLVDLYEQIGRRSEIWNT